VNILKRTALLSFSVYGKRVISRSCFYEDMDDSADKCANDQTSSYIKTVYCRTCTTDGCNGASGATPRVLLLMLPLLLAAAFRHLPLCKWAKGSGPDLTAGLQAEVELAGNFGA